MGGDVAAHSLMIGRAQRIAAIKAVLAAAVLAIMWFTFRYPLPLAVGVLDLVLIVPYVWAVKRYPKMATYLLLAETALALTPRQFVQGYVNGVNWVLYVPLPVAAAYVLGRKSLQTATLLVTVIALPITGLAALTLPPQVSRTEILTLIAYVLVVIWGVSWLSAVEV